MSGRTPWREMRDRAMEDPAVRAAVEEERAALDAALGLARLRRERGLTQSRVAETMGVSQKRVSLIEREGNPELATLRNYALALGGELQVNVVFDDGVVPIADGTRDRDAGRRSRARQERAGRGSAARGAVPSKAG